MSRASVIRFSFDLARSCQGPLVHYPNPPMIPRTLERLNSDTCDLIFQYLCDSPVYNQNPQPLALLPLSLVCKALRLETLRWLFREFHWKLHTHRGFLPHNLQCYMRTLRITANSSADDLPFNQEELQDTFSGLRNTSKLIVHGEGGASHFLLSLLTLMPALGTLEWNDVPFTDIASDFSKIVGILHLTYYENREPSPMTFQLENRHISTVISASTRSLLHLTLPARRALPSILSSCFFPKLRTLVLTGFPPRASESLLYQFLPQMPHLQNLQTRLCLGPRFEIYPNTDDTSKQLIKFNIPILHSLTMYNTVPTDQILGNLPPTLQYLSFAQHPYPYEIIKEQGRHKFPRLILDSKVSYLNRPKLDASDILQSFQRSDTHALRELRLSVSGLISDSWLFDLSLLLPDLEILELHHWHPRTEEKIPSIDHYTHAFAALDNLKELRLDLHLNDEVDNYPAELQKAEAQMTRAAKIAQHATPSLNAIGFLEGHAERGTASPTIFWRMFTVSRKHTSTGDDLLVRQCENFRPYRSEEY